MYLFILNINVWLNFVFIYLLIYLANFFNRMMKVMGGKNMSHLSHDRLSKGAHLSGSWYIFYSFLITDKVLKSYLYHSELFLALKVSELLEQDTFALLVLVCGPTRTLATPTNDTMLPPPQVIFLIVLSCLSHTLLSSIWEKSLPSIATWFLKQLPKSHRYYQLVI